MRTPPVPGVPVTRPPEAPPFASPAGPVIPPGQPERAAVAPPPPGFAPRRVEPARVFNDLSPDERAKLQSAHQAVVHDPNLDAARARYLNARREFRDKLRDALLKADPAVQPILEKIRRDKPDDH